MGAGGSPVVDADRSCTRPQAGGDPQSTLPGHRSTIPPQWSARLLAGPCRTGRGRAMGAGGSPVVDADRSYFGLARIRRPQAGDTATELPRQYGATRAGAGWTPPPPAARPARIAGSLRSMSSWAALLALVPRSLATSHEEAKGVCTVPDCPQHLTASSLRGNYSPRAARRHLAKPAQCAYRADPRKDSGTVAALRQYQRDGGWCRLNIEHSSKNRYSGDWVGMGGQRYFLPLKVCAPTAQSLCNSLARSHPGAVGDSQDGLLPGAGVLLARLVRRGRCRMRRGEDDRARVGLRRGAMLAGQPLAN